MAILKQADFGYTVQEGAALSIAVETGVLANDIDEDGNVLSALLVDNPAQRRAD